MCSVCSRVCHAIQYVRGGWNNIEGSWRRWRHRRPWRRRWRRRGDLRHQRLWLPGRADEPKLRQHACHHPVRGVALAPIRIESVILCSFTCGKQPRAICVRVLQGQVRPWLRTKCKRYEMGKHRYVTTGHVPIVDTNCIYMVPAAVHCTSVTLCLVIPAAYRLPGLHCENGALMGCIHLACPYLRRTPDKPTSRPPNMQEIQGCRTRELQSS